MSQKRTQPKTLLALLMPMLMLSHAPLAAAQPPGKDPDATSLLGKGAIDHLTAEPWEPPVENPRGTCRLFAAPIAIVPHREIDRRELMEVFQKNLVVKVNPEIKIKVVVHNGYDEKPYPFFLIKFDSAPNFNQRYDFAVTIRETPFWPRQTEFIAKGPMLPLFCGLQIEKVAYFALTLRLHFNFTPTRTDLDLIKVFVGPSARRATWRLGPEPGRADAVIRMMTEDFFQKIRVDIPKALGAAQNKSNLYNDGSFMISATSQYLALEGPRFKIPQKILRASAFDARRCVSAKGLPPLPSGGNMICHFNGLTGYGEAFSDARDNLLRQTCKKKIPLVQDFIMCSETVPTEAAPDNGEVVDD